MKTGNSNTDMTFENTYEMGKSIGKLTDNLQLYTVIRGIYHHNKKPSMLEEFSNGIHDGILEKRQLEMEKARNQFLESALDNKKEHRKKLQKIIERKQSEQEKGLER